MLGSQTEAGGRDWPPDDSPDSLEYMFDEGCALRSDSFAKSPIGLTSKSAANAVLNENIFIELGDKRILHFNIRAASSMARAAAHFGRHKPNDVHACRG